jgi:succinate dehydrogenase / fumarate reductase, iron-sulfur subunit
MKFTLMVWRQERPEARGRMVEFVVEDIPESASFLEMLDLVNQEILVEGGDPIAFDHDCREGICGTCALVINGVPHGPERATTTCQLHMRHFENEATITVEPFRARGFPVIKDLIVDRSAFDRIQQAGGFVSVRTGSAPDANSLPVPKEEADKAFAAASCIGCGACVAACKNASAMLFVAAKVGHLNLLPQGKAEKDRRALAMLRQMDVEGFGNCTNYFECEAVCPKQISVELIAKLNRDYAVASLREMLA